MVMECDGEADMMVLITGQAQEKDFARAGAPALWRDGCWVGVGKAENIDRRIFEPRDAHKWRAVCEQDIPHGVVDRTK